MAQWENLTEKDFGKELVKSQKVCVLPIAVMERHGDHLPLGTDVFFNHKIACLAAEIEKAVVFPMYYFTQILEGKHKLGTIALSANLVLELLESVCDEIGRNGFKKIIILNGHGGNPSFVSFFIQSLLNKKKDYMVYYPKESWKVCWEKFKNPKLADNHGGHLETSILLAVCRDLVKMEDVQKPAVCLNRLKHLGDIATPVSWYADYPDHYAGDASKSDINMGKKMLEESVKYTAKVIKIVKQDKVAEKLYNEFFNRSKR